MNEPVEPKRGIEDALRGHTLAHHSQLHLPRRSFGWIIFTLVLIVFLVVQLSFSFRQQLSTIPAAKPWLSIMCQSLPCEIAKTDSYQALRIVSREVIAHPTTKNAVQVNATIINQAKQALPFPNLSLSFKNIDGQVIARRQFSPEEYLTDKLDIHNGMPSQELVRISLDLVDPGNNAVAFEFKFSSVN